MVAIVHIWPIFEIFQSKLNLIWPGLGWPLLAGGRWSEVAGNTGLTVLMKLSICLIVITITAGTGLDYSKQLLESWKTRKFS
jgi:hypothetical protein